MAVTAHMAVMTIKISRLGAMKGVRLRANQTTGAARNPSTSPGTTTETTGASSWKPSNSRLPA
jgi:hypothetical protein